MCNLLLINISLSCCAVILNKVGGAFNLCWSLQDLRVLGVDLFWQLSTGAAVGAPLGLVSKAWLMVTVPVHPTSVRWGSGQGFVSASQVVPHSTWKDAHRAHGFAETAEASCFWTSAHVHGRPRFVLYPLSPTALSHVSFGCTVVVGILLISESWTSGITHPPPGYHSSSTLCCFHAAARWTSGWSGNGRKWRSDHKGSLSIKAH